MKLSQREKDKYLISEKELLWYGDKQDKEQTVLQDDKPMTLGYTTDYGGQSDRTADSAFAFHLVKPGSISGIPFGCPSLSTVISEGSY